MDARNNAIVLAAILLAIVAFYATQRLGGDTAIAIAVGLVIGVVVPAILTGLSSGE